MCVLQSLLSVGSVLLLSAQLWHSASSYTTSAWSAFEWNHFGFLAALLCLLKARNTLCHSFIWTSLCFFFFSSSPAAYVGGCVCACMCVAYLAHVSRCSTLGTVRETHVRPRWLWRRCNEASSFWCPHASDREHVLLRMALRANGLFDGTTMSSSLQTYSPMLCSSHCILYLT